MTATENVVTNVADLSRAMRTALLEEHATRQTTEALIKRGLVSGRAGSPRGNHYPLTLTDTGRRAAEAIRAEIDATPVVPVRSIASAISTLAETRGVDSGTPNPRPAGWQDDPTRPTSPTNMPYRALASVAVHDGVYLDLDNGLTGFADYLAGEYRDARTDYRTVGDRHDMSVANAMRAALRQLHIWTQGRHGSVSDQDFPRVGLADGPAKSGC